MRVIGRSCNWHIQVLSTTTIYLHRRVFELNLLVRIYPAVACVTSCEGQHDEWRGATLINLFARPAHTIQAAIAQTVNGIHKQIWKKNYERNPKRKCLCVLNSCKIFYSRTELHTSITEILAYLNSNCTVTNKSMVLYYFIVHSSITCTRVCKADYSFLSGFMNVFLSRWFQAPGNFAAQSFAQRSLNHCKADREKGVSCKVRWMVVRMITHGGELFNR